MCKCLLLLTGLTWSNSENGPVEQDLVCMCWCQNHVIEVPPTGNKKWMKNKKKTGKKAKKKGGGGKGVPAKKTNVANSLPNTAASTSSLASSSADVVDKKEKDARPAGHTTSPADSVSKSFLYFINLYFAKDAADREYKGGTIQKREIQKLQ